MKKTIPECGFRPLSNYVVVLLDEVPKETAGGIALPESVIKPSTEGVIVAVGPGVTRSTGVVSPTDLRPGDRVKVSGRAQTPWTHDGIDFAIMRAPEVLYALQTTN